MSITLDFLAIAEQWPLLLRGVAFTVLHCGLDGDCGRAGHGAGGGLRLGPYLGSNLGACAAEIVRAGIEATPRGQIEAGLSLALTRGQVFLRVVLPPSLSRVWPTMVSQIIIVMLGSAVCGQIATQELSYYANLIQSRNFRAFEAYIVATLIYLLLAIALRQLLRWAGPRFLFGR